MNFEYIKRSDEFKELYTFEQKIIAKTDINEKLLKKYGLLNHEWIEKYKNNYNYEFYLQTGQIMYNSIENIFIIEALSPKLKNFWLDENKKKIEINIPHKFVLVSKKFIDLISKNFNAEGERERLLRLCYEALMIQKNLFIIDNEKNMILYYLLNKNNKIFNIHSILKYTNQEQMSNEIKVILKEDFNNYLNERNISIYNQSQKILLNGQKIGLFYSLIFNKLNKNQINISDINENINKIKNKNILSLNEYLNSIFLCLYQFKDLNQGISVKNNDVNQNEAIIIVNDFFKNFQTFKKKSFKKIHSVFKYEIPYTYNKTISLIFKRLNPEKIQDNKNTLDNNYNQTIQFDEKEQKLIFLRNHETNSIIQKLFFCIQETGIYCPTCSLNSYEFKYLNYISITNILQNKIQNNIFRVIKTKKNIKCNFCGITNDLFFTRHITDFSKIIIIILGDIYDFNFKENLNIVNYNIRYELICFIDQKNEVYFKKDNVWNSYDINYNEQRIKSIDNIKPVVLFYELEKNNRDNHNSSNKINNSNFNICN